VRIIVCSEMASLNRDENPTAWIAVGGTAVMARGYIAMWGRG
jgi:hypothetical protein